MREGGWSYRVASLKTAPEGPLMMENKDNGKFGEVRVDQKATPIKKYLHGALAVFYTD